MISITNKQYWEQSKAIKNSPNAFYQIESRFPEA